MRATRRRLAPTARPTTSSRRVCRVRTVEAPSRPSIRHRRGDGVRVARRRREIHPSPSTQEAAEELPPLPDRGDGAKGVLPRVLKNIISKRREVKGLLKKEKNVKKRETYEIRQMALKLTANSMYGCLGFSHSRFYAKPLAALVTSLGRDTLQATADVAEKELGLEVIYGDTDSIMINTRTDDLAVVKELGLKVKKAVNKRYRLLELEFQESVALVDRFFDLEAQVFDHRQIIGPCINHDAVRVAVNDFEAELFFGDVGRRL